MRDQHVRVVNRMACIGRRCARRVVLEIDLRHAGVARAENRMPIDFPVAVRLIKNDVEDAILPLRPP